MFDWVILGGVVVVLVVAVWLATRADVLFRRVRELETRLTELGRGLGEEVAEKVSLESQALREEVANRLGAVQACVDRLETIEGRLKETIEGSGDPDPKDLADAVRPLLREAVESIDGRLRQVTESLRAPSARAPDTPLARSLAERGFSDVVVAREATMEDGRTKVIVEARRDGMTFKGPVILDGDHVVEQRLAPAYPMFP
ncbi:MAG: hypothetical protein ABFS86_04650 [Planctomycetota bacterium]